MRMLHRASGAIAVLGLILWVGMGWSFDHWLHDWIHQQAGVWQKSAFVPWHFFFYLAPKFLLALSGLYWLIRGWQGDRASRYACAYALTLILLVPMLKWWTNTACPWDHQRYGGALLPTVWFNQGTQGAFYQCFPAGHATVGFALLGWCFLSWKAWYARCWSLFFLWGWCLGAYQMIRGAHYWSHTATTAWIACVLFFSFESLRARMHSKRLHHAPE